MGKYKHEGKGRNISIGGGKERSDLFKDMSGGYNAMGDSNKPSPLYNYGGNSAAKRYSPMKKALVGDQNQLPDHLVKAIKAAPEMKGSPMHKSPYKVIGDPNKKMDRLSARHKSLYDRFEMGQTSESEEQRMYKLEDRMDKVGKKIKKSKKSPLNQGKKIKKAAKTQAQIDKIRSSFGTKDADVSGRFERKRKKMDKTVGQLEKKGIKVDYDTTGPEGEGSSRKSKKSPLNQGTKVKKAVRKAKKYIKAKDSVKKQEEKGNYNSFRDEGTKKAKRKVKKASKKHDKMRKAVDKLSTSEKKEALKINPFKNK